MEELTREIIQHPWVILVVIGALWLLKHRKGIKKGIVTAKKPFDEATRKGQVAAVPPDDNFGDDAGPLSVIK